MGRPVDVHRPLAGDARAVGDHPQADDLRADGRPGGRADRGPARAGRRRAELGLPLHLGPRRLVLGVRAARPGLHRRGGGVRGWLRRPGGGERVDRRRAAAQHHVPRRRLARPRGGGRSTTGRATAARARCASATAPPSQLQLDIYGEALDSIYYAGRARPRRRPPRMAGDLRPARLARRQLGPARGGHLGDPRRPQGLHLRPRDVLGRVRPGHPAGRRARPPGTAGPLDRARATRSTSR